MECDNTRILSTIPLQYCKDKYDTFHTAIHRNVIHTPISIFAHKINEQTQTTHKFSQCTTSARIPNNTFSHIWIRFYKSIFPSFFHSLYNFEVNTKPPHREVVINIKRLIYGIHFQEVFNRINILYLKSRSRYKKLKTKRKKYHCIAKLSFVSGYISRGLSYIRKKDK